MKLLFTLFASFLLTILVYSNGICNQPVSSMENNLQVATKNEAIDININSEKYGYIYLKFENISKEPAIIWTSSSLKGKTLDDTQQGPIAFRKFTLYKKNDKINKTFLCEGKDKLSVHVESGTISVLPVNFHK